MSLRKTATVEWTTAQKRLWDVLQEEKNRHLPIEEICKRAGYRSMSAWYRAMEGDAFRVCVEALGIPIHRQASPNQGIIPLAENADEEWQKDFIDVRRLIPEYPKHHGAGAFQLNFSCIQALLSSQNRLLGS